MSINEHYFSHIFTYMQKQFQLLFEKKVSRTFLGKFKWLAYG